MPGKYQDDSRDIHERQNLLEIAEFGETTG